jgi:hypothetical protein
MTAIKGDIMSDLHDLAEEVFNYQSRTEYWDNSIFDNLQENLNSLDSFWSVEDFDYDELVKTIKRTLELYEESKNHLYRSDHRVYLELSDNRTMWEINSDIDEDEYYNIVENACNKFLARTEVEIYRLGRSGRHICVDYTYDNVVKYDELCKVQQALEKEVVDRCNV